MEIYPYHINDPEFAEVLVDSFLQISGKNVADPSTQKLSSDEHNKELHEDAKSEAKTSSYSCASIHYSLSELPDANKGSLFTVYLFWHYNLYN